MKLYLFFVSLMVSLNLSAQKLDLSKDSLKSDSSSSIATSSSSSSDSDDNEENSFLDDLMFELILKPLVFITLTVTKEVFIESHAEEEHNHSYMELKPYPYYENTRGDYAYLPKKDKKFRFDISNQILSEGTSVFANNLNLEFRFLDRLAIHYNQFYFWDADHPDSNLFFHHFTANYYRVRTQSFTFHYGLGLSYIYSDVNDLYTNFELGMDYYLKKPLSISLDYKGLISKNAIQQVGLNLNYHIKKYAINAGFTYFDIGNVSYQMFGIGGKIYL